MGCSENVKGHRVFYEKNNKVHIERDVWSTCLSIKWKMLMRVENSGIWNHQVRQFLFWIWNNWIDTDVTLKLPQHLKDNYQLGFFSLDEDEPMSFEEAMKSKCMFQNGRRQWRMK